MKVKKVTLADQKDLLAIAKLYCQIWQEPPWNEDFWTVEGVMKDLAQELSYACAVCFGWFFAGQAIGFTWGYQVDKKRMRQISSGKLLDSLFRYDPFMFYIDELAVAKAERQKGFGKILTRQLIAEVQSRYNLRICLRTDAEAVAAKAVYQQFGFKDLGLKDAQYPTRTYWLLI